jgi:1-aminocyclopropane-1-carboxylate deaminase/D-cysteine desulfhydrase-like pyridoxal-dependent ACC family enzyme
MQFPDISKITTDDASNILLPNNKAELHVLRLDKIHPVISGNKWFKLKYHFENFRAENYKGIVTFGGAWSNHIVAAACACYQQQIPCTGIIRGEKPGKFSASLLEAQQYKMNLHFISRNEYANKNENGIPEKIIKDFPGCYFIPEGGAGEHGEKGAAEIMNLVVQNEYTHIACAMGTGTMFKGLQKAAASSLQIIGIPVLKGWLEKIETGSNAVFTEYHFGGYAKYTTALLSFMNDFYNRTGIPLDFVYTGKLAFAIADLAEKKFFAAGSKILMIHSGGLQGNASLEKGSLIF